MLGVSAPARGPSWLMDAATARRSPSTRCPHTSLVIVMLACPKISETTCSGVPWASSPAWTIERDDNQPGGCGMRAASTFRTLRRPHICFAMQQRAATSRRLQGGGGPAPSPHQKLLTVTTQRQALRARKRSIEDTQRGAGGAGGRDETASTSAEPGDVEPVRRP